MTCRLLPFVQPTPAPRMHFKSILVDPHVFKQWMQDTARIPTSNIEQHANFTSPAYLAGAQIMPTESLALNTCSVLRAGQLCESPKGNLLGICRRCVFTRTRRYSKYGTPTQRILLSLKLSTEESQSLRKTWSLSFDLRFLNCGNMKSVLAPADVVLNIAYLRKSVH